MWVLGGSDCGEETQMIVWASDYSPLLHHNKITHNHPVELLLHSLPSTEAQLESWGCLLKTGAMNHSIEQREVPARAKRQHFSWFNGQMEEKIHFELTWIEIFSIFPVKQKVEKKLMADCFLFQPLFIFCSITFPAPFRGSFRACFITPSLQVCGGGGTSFAQSDFASGGGLAGPRRAGKGLCSDRGVPLSWQLVTSHIPAGTPFAPDLALLLPADN